MLIFYKNRIGYQNLDKMKKSNKYKFKKYIYKIHQFENVLKLLYNVCEKLLTDLSNANFGASSSSKIQQVILLLCGFFM